MKPAPFEYFAPADLEEALELLAQYGDEAKILAGGQSLMPLLNMRLARPRVVIDINRVSDLDYIAPGADGALAIGALTRQRAIERSGVVQMHHPMLAAAMPYIGHFQIRNRGTVGGSIVHADPAAELPALSLALEAQFMLRSATQQRVIDAADFFLTYLTTALEPVEMLTEIRLPAGGPQWRWGFQEVCRREGDFALVGAVAMLRMNDHAVCQAARLTMFGVGGIPVRLGMVEEMLYGRQIDDRKLNEVANVVADALEPDSDLHASAEYRKEVGGVMARRALEVALGSTWGRGNR
ncbi:MAG TPA: xanthine dehydrogenase family protein subunit M [Candidatus Tectomicrobia bacterium]|nr:xanthine dehydrogenase family protein subunit M [Candidatus Tectomicrobia bacterium]